MPPAFGWRLASPSGITASVALLLLAVLPGATSVAGADTLYETRTIVTGQREETRAGGFAVALEAVLVKVSGDPRLIGHPRVEAMAKGAGSSVAAFRYRDRMEGIPVHDEQGTRDRPYDLFVSFDPEKIDAMLRSLGRDKWPAPRPRLAVLVAVEIGASRYLLASDGERGRDQREALAAAADGLGVPLAVPSQAALAEAGLSLEAVAMADAASLEAAARAVGGYPALAGSLVWSEEALGWVADWRLASGGEIHRWRISGVSFDDAFRNAVRGAAQIMSGHGEPS
jgi:uncharacterized protein